MKKSTMYELIVLAGVGVLIGCFLWGGDMLSFQNRINEISLKSAEVQPAFDTNKSISDANLSDPENAENSDKQLKPILKVQAFSSPKDYGSALWLLVLEPMLLLLLFIGIPVQLFETIRRNVKKKRHAHTASS